MSKKKSRRQESIQSVINRFTGEQVNAVDYFKNESDTARKLEITEDRVKTDLNPKASKYLCSYCKETIQIYGSITKEKNKQKRHFRHAKSINSSCPFKLNSDLSKDQINLIRYFSKRESLVHKRLKSEIKTFLQLTPRTSDIKEEKWEINKSNVKNHSRRRPDLKFVFKKLDIAFEIQVNQLFLSVINERTQFYKDNKIYLLWIFDEYLENDKEPNLYMDDILITQNRNIYVFDYHAKELSKANETLHLKCIYHVPKLDVNSLNDSNHLKKNEYPIYDEVHETYITLDQLNYDDQNNETYFFNYNFERDKLINDEIQRENDRVFRIGENSKTSSIFNGDRNFKKNISNLIKRIKAGTRSICEYEKTKEFNSIQKGFKQQQNEIEQISEQIEREKLSHSKREIKLNKEKEEYQDLLEEQTDFLNVSKNFARKRKAFRRRKAINIKLRRAATKRIAKERTRIAERIRSQKANLKTEAKEEIEQESINRRDSIESELSISRNTIEKNRESIINIIKRIRKKRKDSEKLERELANSKKRIRIEVSEEHKKNRTRIREAFYEANKGNSSAFEKGGISRKGFEAWQFLNNLEEKKQLFERLKDASKKI